MTSAETVVHYMVNPSDLFGHYFDVEIRVNRPTKAGQILSLPTWIPGSYLIREFSKNIGRVSGFDHNGHDLEVRKVAKSTWRISTATTGLLVTYRVYAWDASVRAAHLDDSHGFFNGTSLFLAVDGMESTPCRLTIARPAQKPDWVVATTLPSLQADPHDFGTFEASNYDELIDHPVELGTPTLFTFEACGVQHEVALTGVHDADTDRLATDLKRICEHHIRFFGEPAPVNRYLFMVNVVGSGYGGLEHRSSTALICSREDLPRRGVSEISDGYRKLLGLCSHEYLHTWNVKRIKPAKFTPYELSKETYTTLLWVFEGITSYYDDLALIRSGTIDADSYLELLGQQISAVTRNPGRLQQTLAESSFDTWIKLYRPDENSRNTSISYYTKGSIVALALDLTIRLQTHDRNSLDDVMLEAWRRHGQTLVGIAEDGFEVLVTEVTGLDLTEFFDQYIRNVDEVPLKTLLSQFGIVLHGRPASGSTDRGGKPAKASEEFASSLGVLCKKSATGVSLATVFNGSSAHIAGLSAGDVIIAVDGIQITSAKSLEAIQTRPPDSVITVHAFREDILQCRELTLQAPSTEVVWLALNEKATDMVAKRRDLWLK